MSSLWNEGVNMNDILFRAKAINRKEGFEYHTNYKNGDWVYGLITKKFDDKFPIFPAEMTNEDGVSGIDVDYKTIGQYTGLCDNSKNGTRIFEGDILKISFGKEFLKAVVKFGYYNQPDKILKSHLGFYFDFVDSKSYRKDVGYWTGRTLSEIEVIGNIYDNSRTIGG